MAPSPSKSSNRISLNRVLFSIALAAFFLTVNLKEEFFFDRVLILQLVLSIPLLLTSMLAYSKVGYRTQTRRWNKLAWITFAFGYGFLLNVIGILLAKTSGILISIVFFVSTWVLAIIYSLVDISYDKRVLKERLYKDLLFISIQILLGVFVVLNVY
jgi:uncharacterized membrane protein (DUF485 family)